MLPANEGRGYVHSNDVVNGGFIQGETSHVVVQVVYDEPALIDDYEGVDVQRITRELKPKDPLALNLMRITVDGEPSGEAESSPARSGTATGSRWLSPGRSPSGSIRPHRGC